MSHPDAEPPVVPEKLCETINISYINTYGLEKAATQKQINADIIKTA